MPGRRPKEGEDAARICIHGVVVVRIAQKRILQKEKNGREQPMGGKGPQCADCRLPGGKGMCFAQCDRFGRGLRASLGSRGI